MPNKLISRQKLRHLLRLYSQGKGTKAIASYLSMSRTTVKKYLLRFKEVDMDLEEVLGLSDKDLSSLLQEKEAKPVNERQQVIEKLLPLYFKRLKRKGVTRKMLYDEYREKYPDGYSHSRFCDYLNRYQATHNVVMHIEHKAGDKLFIDFAGKKLSLVDKSTGEVTWVEVFVAILPCSQLTYVEAVASQKKEDLILACEHTLQYIEGVPQVIFPDNLRAAVTKS